MALPSFQALGVTQEDATLGSITVPWPASHAINDVALLVVECTGGQAASLTTANGFVEVTNSPQNTGTTTAGTRIHTYWCRATSTSMASPVVAVGGNHGFGYILTFRNVLATGSPINITAGAVKAVASTSASAPTATTTVANCLVVNIISRDDDSAVAEFSAWANAALSSITEIADAGTNLGNGGGIGVAAGVKVAAGATGATTATVVSSINASLTVALAPAAPVATQAFGQAQATILGPLPIARLVQVKSARFSSVSSGTITLDNVPTLGNYLIAYVSYQNTSGPPVFASGQGGVTSWTQKMQGNSFNSLVLNHGLVNGTPSASIAFTAAGSNDTYQFFVEEWSGPTTVDVSSTASTGTSTAPSNSITTVAAKTLISNAFATFSGVTGTLDQYASRDDAPVTGTNPTVRVNYRYEKTAAAYTGSYTIGSSVDWADFSVSFPVGGLQQWQGGQAQTWIKSTSNGFGQAQADIKAAGQGFAQAQADIKAIRQGFGQAQASISGASLGFGQAQADIKAVGKGFGQAQTNIKAVGRGFGQAQADIKATYQWQTISKDTFTDTPTTLLTAHVPDIGPMWTGADSRWSIGTNNLAVNILGSVGNTARLSLGRSDVVITCDIIKDVGTPNGGILFRYSDASNYWKVTFDNITIWNLTKVVAGTPTVVATTSSAISGHTEVYLNGNTISVALPNGPILATSDSFNATATIHGIIEEDGSNANEFDNWNVYAPTLNTAQAQASIKATSNQFGQAQADIKAINRGFGQSQADINATSRGYAQAQTDIKAVGRGVGQAQAAIVTSSIYSRLIESYSGLISEWRLGETTGNTHALDSWGHNSGTYIGPPSLGVAPLLGTANGIDTSVLFDGSTSYVTIPSAASLNPISAISLVAWINAEHTITTTSMIISKGDTNQFSYEIRIAGGSGKVTALFYQADGAASVTATGTTDVRTNSVYFVVATFDGTTAKVYVNEVLEGSGTNGAVTWYTASTAALNIAARVGANKLLSIVDEVAIYSRVLLASEINDLYQVGAGLRFAQAQAYIKTTGINKFGQAQARIKAVGQGYGQAQVCIKGNGFGQAQADIKATSQTYGQAQADIKAVSYGFGQAQADIKATSRGYGQAQTDIVAKGFGYGQAQADIKATNYGFGQANVDILAKSNGYGQAQADIKATGSGFGQAQADILATGYGFGQAQADIKSVSYGFGQAQATINASGTFGWGQAQVYVSGQSFAYGQAQAKIKATYAQFAQAQADIKAVGYGFAQAQADIKAKGFGYAQAQADIKQTSQGYGQAQALIFVTEQGYGQAQAQIKATTSQSGQAQADIRQTYTATGQAQADVRATYKGFGQAQGYISTVGYGFGQAQCTIRGNSFGQAQTWIKTTVTQYGNAQATIQTSVTTTGQANALIVRTETALGQAQAQISASTNQFAQAQARIISTNVNAFGQAQAFIAKSAGYGQAQAFIFQTHTLKTLVVSDRSMTLVLTDIERVLETADTSLKLTLSDYSLGLSLTDREWNLALHDEDY